MANDIIIRSVLSSQILNEQWVELELIFVYNCNVQKGSQVLHLRVNLHRISLPWTAEFIDASYVLHVIIMSATRMRNILLAGMQRVLTVRNGLEYLKGLMKGRESAVDVWKTGSSATLRREGSPLDPCLMKTLMEAVITGKSFG